MKEFKIKIIYDGKQYEFTEGLQAYIFHLRILHEHDKKFGLEALLEYVNKTCRCIDADSNTLRIEDFACYVSNFWEYVNDLDTYDVLEQFYEYEEE